MEELIHDVLEEEATEMKNLLIKKDIELFEKDNVIKNSNQDKYKAIEKRKAMGKKNLKEVDVTVATIGDSRTGKSEMAEKMEGVLNMSLI